MPSCPTWLFLSGLTRDLRPGLIFAVPGGTCFFTRLSQGFPAYNLPRCGVSRVAWVQGEFGVPSRSRQLLADKSSPIFNRATFGHLPRQVSQRGTAQARVVA